MADFENIVMAYLAAQGLFLSPQYPISSNGKEWSCPDFLGLNIPEREIYIIEVSIAYDCSRLVQKINDRDNQWISKLKDQLAKRNIGDDSWRYVVRVFIRRDRKDYFYQNVKDMKDVKIEILEDIPYPWSKNYYKF